MISSEIFLDRLGLIQNRKKFPVTHSWYYSHRYWKYVQEWVRKYFKVRLQLKPSQSMAWQLVDRAITDQEAFQLWVGRATNYRLVPSSLYPQWKTGLNVKAIFPVGEQKAVSARTLHTYIQKPDFPSQWTLWASWMQLRKWVGKTNNYLFECFTPREKESEAVKHGVPFYTL